MKHLCRGFGIVLLICGVLIYIIAGAGQEATEPNHVSVGYIADDGYFVETNSGYMGGNQEGHEEMGYLKGIGIIAGIAGGILLFASFKIKEY